MVRALQRSILGRNCGASFCSISDAAHAALAERDGERQPDRAGPDDENLGVRRHAMCGEGGYRLASTTMPASVTTFCHLTMSPAMKSRKRSGVPPPARRPCLASFSTTCGVRRISLMVAL